MAASIREVRERFTFGKFPEAASRFVRAGRKYLPGKVFPGYGGSNCTLYAAPAVALFNGSIAVPAGRAPTL